MHPSNTSFPISVTELGIATDVSPLHPENASSPMLVTELGIVTDVSLLQPENASLPMLVTELGIAMSVLSPIYATRFVFLNRKKQNHRLLCR